MLIPIQDVQRYLHLISSVDKANLGIFSQIVERYGSSHTLSIIAERTQT